MNNVCECLDLDHLLHLSPTSKWCWIDYCGLRRADKPSLVPPVPLSIYSFFLILYIPFVSWPSHIISYLYPRIDWACVFRDSRHFRHLFRIFAKLIQASAHSEKFISKTTYHHSFGAPVIFYVTFARLGMFESTI